MTPHDRFSGMSPEEIAIDLGLVDHPIDDEPRSKPKPRPRLMPKATGPTVFSAAELGGMVFPPIKWIVPGLIPEGCTILAGRPKLGKSFLALDVALAVARGGYCLGDYQCEQGAVLYLALEDNRRRLKARIEKVSPASGDSTPGPKSLQFATEWTGATKGVSI